MAKERTDKKPLPHSNVFVNRIVRLERNFFRFGPAIFSLEGVCGAVAELHFLPLQKTVEMGPWAQSRRSFVDHCSPTRTPTH